MKTLLLIIRQLLATLLLVLFSKTAGISQEKASARRDQSHLLIGLNLIPSQSKITNNGTSFVTKVASTKKTTISGLLELSYYFSRLAGFTTGLGYGSFSSDFTLDSCTNNFNLTDSENEAYQKRVKGSRISELQKISLLTVPVCISFQVPFTHRFGAFIQAGVNLSFPLGKSYTSSGTFTYSSYYPAYNVLLKDIPAFGLVTNSKVSSSGNLELKKVNIYATVSAGVHYFISSKIQIGLGLNYYRSLSTISNYGSPDKFQLSIDPGKINSIMGGGSNISAQALGLRISVKYYLR
jgi:hypothetical protein